jgi:hypothetical protein
MPDDLRGMAGWGPWPRSSTSANSGTPRD